MSAENRLVAKWRWSFLGIFLGILFFATFLTPSSALASTEWTGSTFTYDGRTYPDNLYGVTVTINANPGKPDSYQGNSGGNIMWYGNRFYTIGATSPAGSLDYFYSEPSSVNNPWYMLYSQTQSTSSGLGFFYDANHGWGFKGTGTVTASTRTITFGNLFTSYSDAQTYGKILFLHDFVRYIVDNSDFRSRYTFPASPVSWSNATVSYSQSEHALSWSVPSGNPAFTLRVYYSDDNSTWSIVQIYQPGSYAGSYVLPYEGYYRLEFKSSDLSSTYQTYTTDNKTWTASWADATISTTGNIISWSIPTINVQSGLTISVSPDGIVWSPAITYSIAPSTGSYTPDSSGYYKLTFGSPGTSQNDSHVWQTYTTDYLSVAIVDNRPVYVSYYWYPETGTLLVQFSASSTRPSSVTLQGSYDGNTWYDLATDRSVTSQEFYNPGANLPDGWYAEFLYLTGSRQYRVVVNDESTYLIGSLSSNSSLQPVDNNTPSWMAQTVQWIEDFINGLQPFFDSLLGWMPRDFRDAFFTLVLISLFIGIITIIRD